MSGGVRKRRPRDGAPPASPRPKIRASAGIAVLGKRVIVHGLDLHHDCLGLSFVHYCLLCATGRCLDSSTARTLERMWIVTGNPDARIWCNRVVAYMGSARVDPPLSLSAGMAAIDSVGYGSVALRRAYEVQASIPPRLDRRRSWLAEQLRRKRILSGYGRPIHGEDERIAAALHVLVEESVTAGPALKRAFWLHDELRRTKNIAMNICAFLAAFAIDIGFAVNEFEVFMLLMPAPGFMAVYLDQRARGPLKFLSGHQSF